MFYLFNLLEAETTEPPKNYTLLIILCAILVLWVVMSLFTGKKRREQAAKEKEKREAIKIGYRVLTIGGIVGTVVAVDEENNTFVLETGLGDEKSYIKFDKVAIYNSENPDEANATEESPVNNEEVFTDENAEENLPADEEVPTEENQDGDKQE